MQMRFVTGLCALLALSACAAPEVDRGRAGFDTATYSDDLNRCRGGSFLMASWKTLGVAILGSAYGALYGAHVGANEGDTAEGAAIGAAVGGAIGLGAGSRDALARRDYEIASCLAKKGYRVIG